MWRDTSKGFCNAALTGLNLWCDSGGSFVTEHQRMFRSVLAPSQKSWRVASHVISLAIQGRERAYDNMDSKRVHNQLRIIVRLDISLGVLPLTLLTAPSPRFVYLRRKKD